MSMNSKIRSYSEMIKLNTFEERFNYLKLDGRVGEETFGSKRLINQILYRQSKRWKATRDRIIIRDNGCDLGAVDHPIPDGVPITIHHINPITVEDILNDEDCVFDEDNLISTTLHTHNAIHYSNDSILVKDPVIRTKNDTCPWK